MDTSIKSHSQKREWLTYSFLTAILTIVFLTTSCASNRNFTQVDAHAYSGNFSVAHEELEEKSETLYQKTDQVLYALDAGMLSHYAKNYELSNEKLSDAEKLIEEYFAISISQTVGSYILNDNVTDYPGEDFEDIYTNLFMALNYIQMGNTEAAFVEIRRFNNKLQLLATKYSAALEQAKISTAQQGYSADGLLSSAQNVEPLEFYDSAFARYVSLLLYRSTGQIDSAEVDKRFIERAFANQPQLYPFPIPKAIEEEFSIPSDKERLNVFCYTGIAPEKEEETLRLPGLIDDTWFKLALPIMIQNSSSVSSIEITATDSQGTTKAGTLQQIESIENIALDTFQQRQGLIYLKALLRSISKTAVNEGVSTVMENTNAAPWASVFKLAANVYTEFSEQADIRSSRYFPASVWVGGLNLNKGLYSVTITCYDTFNNIVFHQKTENVDVKHDAVNLVEAAYLN